MGRLVFGEVTFAEAVATATPEQTLTRQQITVNGKLYDRRLVNSKPAHNPCLDVFGAGPEGAGCKDCSHLELHNGGSKDYYKCNLRPITGGPGTDHRLKWPACGRYEER